VGVPESHRDEGTLAGTTGERGTRAIPRNVILAIGLAVVIVSGLLVATGFGTGSLRLTGPDAGSPSQGCRSSCAPPFQVPISQALAISPAAAGPACSSAGNSVSCSETLTVQSANHGINAGDGYYLFWPNSAPSTSNTAFTIAFEYPTGCMFAEESYTGLGTGRLVSMGSNSTCQGGSTGTPFAHGDTLALSFQTNSTAYANSGGYQLQIEGDFYEFTGELMVPV
jgi:hypothetical protein